MQENVELIYTRTSDGKVFRRVMATSNWFNVYLDNARVSGRRINWLNGNAYDVIYTEKGYTLTVTRKG